MGNNNDIAVAICDLRPYEQTPRSKYFNKHHLETEKLHHDGRQLVSFLDVY